MKSDDQTPIDSNNPRQNPGVSEKRRRLLKASAAAVPLVGTLRSGAALANTSAFQCLQIDENKTPSPQVNDTARHIPGTAGWYEVKGDLATYTEVYSWTGGGDPPTNPPNPKSEKVYRFDNKFFESGSNYLEKEISEPELSEAPDGYEVDWANIPPEDKYALYYFRPESTYLGYDRGPVLLNPFPGSDPNDNGWMALTGSCWASIMGTPG